MFSALGVKALIPRSFSIDARPMFTENVEHEFLRDSPDRGVGGAVVCLEWHTEATCEDICDGGILNVSCVVPSSGCIIVLLVNVYTELQTGNRRAT